MWMKHFNKLDFFFLIKKIVKLESLKLEFQDFSQGTRV